MAGDCSFDIVSQFDEQELVNAIDQTRREVQTRYDLKDTKTDIVHNKDNITILRIARFHSKMSGISLSLKQFAANYR